jgi:hypothetical protein
MKTILSDAVYPFLVSVRDPRSAAHLGGTVHVFVAMTMTQMAARNAVSEALPDGWRIEDVLGVAQPSVVPRCGLRAGSVEELGTGEVLRR